MKRRRIETADEFYQEYGINIDDIPDPTEEEIQRMLDIFAVLYRKVCEDEKLDALEQLWEMADEEPEIAKIFRRVHEDPSYGHESMLTVK
jgi:hypothetical protein